MQRAFVIVGTLVFVVFYGHFLRNMADAGHLMWVGPLGVLAALYFCYLIGDAEDRAGYHRAGAKIMGWFAMKSLADASPQEQNERAWQRLLVLDRLAELNEHSQTKLWRFHPASPLARLAFWPRRKRSAHGVRLSRRQPKRWRSGACLPTPSQRLSAPPAFG